MLIHIPRLDTFSLVNVANTDSERCANKFAKLPYKKVAAVNATVRDL